MTLTDREAEAWGHKLTVHIYLAGEPSEWLYHRVIEAVNGALPDAEFVGMDMRIVRTKPKDQVGT